MIKIDNIHKKYNLGKIEVPVLKGVSLSVKDGEWVALLGASGCGKTTLLNIIGTLETPDKGEVFIRDKAISSFIRKEKESFRNKRVGFIFQTYHLLPELTVLENVLLPATFANTKLSNAKMKAKELIEQVGLSHRIKHKPMELSGGERQRAAIARALINNPEIILADEPTGNLDSKTGQEILNVFQQLKNDGFVKTIIMVTHDEKIAELANKIIRLKDGVIV